MMTKGNSSSGVITPRFCMLSLYSCGPPAASQVISVTNI